MAAPYALAKLAACADVRGRAAVAVTWRSVRSLLSLRPRLATGIFAALAALAPTALVAAAVAVPGGEPGASSGTGPAGRPPGTTTTGPGAPGPPPPLFRLAGCRSRAT